MKSNNFQAQLDNNQTIKRSISRGLHLTGQAIYVIWMREMKRFFRAKSRLISNLAMPFFFLFAMNFGFGGKNMPGTFQGVDYRFLKEIMVAPIKRPVIILGRIAGGVTTNLIQGILILIISLLMGFKMAFLLSLAPAILFMVLISVGFSGLSVVIASIMEDPQGFPLVMHFFTFPCFLFSGALFPIANFPNWIRPLSLINPLTYGVDGLRASLINCSRFPLVWNLSILLIFGLVMIILGSYLFSKTEV